MACDGVRAHSKLDTCELECCLSSELRVSER